MFDFVWVEKKAVLRATKAKTQWLHRMHWLKLLLLGKKRDSFLLLNVCKLNTPNSREYINPHGM